MREQGEGEREKEGERGGEGERKTIEDKKSN